NFHPDQPLRGAVDGARFGQHGAGAMHLPVSDDVEPLGHVYSLLSRRPGGFEAAPPLQTAGRAVKVGFLLGSRNRFYCCRCAAAGIEASLHRAKPAPGPDLHGTKSLAMLQSFRSFFQSKIGIVVTLAFLGLIAIAFASSDVANTGTFGGIAGGDRVAVVGDDRVSSSDLSRATTSALESARQQNPTLTMEAFLAQGALDEVLSQMLQRFAIAEYGEQIGHRAGNNLVNSELLQIDAFRGADGN